MWRSLKALGNNARFQFILLEELAAIVSLNKGAPVGKKTRNVQLKAKPPLPDVLDPSKLTLMDDTFRITDTPAPQISP